MVFIVIFLMELVAIQYSAVSISAQKQFLLLTILQGRMVFSKSKTSLVKIAIFCVQLVTFH